MILRYAKTRDVKDPVRGHSTDAGIDFFVPNLCKEFVNDLRKVNEEINKNTEILESGEMTLRHGCGILIPSGIITEINFGTMGIFLNKSGVASKKHMLIGAQVIDTFYSGEVHINLHNVGIDEVVIKPGDKVVQFVKIPIMTPIPKEYPKEELYKEMKEKEYRDEGGFGSTDKKK